MRTIIGFSVLALALASWAAPGLASDGGPGTLGFDEQTIETGAADTSVDVFVERSHGSQGAVSVSLAVSAGTAVAGQDFDAATGTLSWADGEETAKSFTVTLHPSSASVGKTVLLALSNPTGGATLDPDRSQATLVLGGADAGENAGAGTIKFDEASFEALASAGVAVITVEREEGSQGAVSIDFATSDGTAVAGTDYTSARGTLSWADGESGPKTFQVTLLPPSGPGPAKTVLLALSNPTGGAVLDSAHANATLMIENQDTAAPPADGAGLLGFDESQISAIQGSGAVTVRVERSGGHSGAVTVAYDTSDGTAVAGTDYQPASGTLSWADGQQGVMTFQVLLLNNPSSTSNRAINLTLHDPTGGAALAAGNANATIVILNTSGDKSACQPGDGTLCMMAGRFRARVTWRIQGSAGGGHAQALSATSGTFWFFDPNNVEMLVKVVNACTPPFNRYWVFYSATTNVGFTLEVTDTKSGVVKDYSNPFGLKAESQNDTNSFATCP